MKASKSRISRATVRSKKADRLIKEAIQILSALGVPAETLTKRRADRMAMAFLAVAALKLGDSWKSVKSKDDRHALKTREIIVYVNKHFGEKISSGSYDDIRRQDLELPVLAGIVLPSAGNPNAARTDPTRAYAIDPECAKIIGLFGEQGWDSLAAASVSKRSNLRKELAAERSMSLVPITVGLGKTLEFSPGKHNELQKAIIEQFLPRYGHGAEVLYVGDTAHKKLFINEGRLKELEFFELAHGELPDVLAYSAGKNWLYLIEAVHSANPISPTRHLKLRKLTNGCKAGIVYVTAFLDRKTFKKFADQISWETEVWIEEAPDHLIHFNGDKFLGPYRP